MGTICGDFIKNGGRVGMFKSMLKPMINHPQPEMGWISIPNLVVCGINGLPHYVTSQVLQLFHNHGILQMNLLIIQIQFYIAGQFLHHPRYLPGPSRESSPCSLGPRVRVLVFCCVTEMRLQWNPLFKASDTGEARDESDHVTLRHAWIFPEWHQKRMAFISWIGKDQSSWSLTVFLAARLEAKVYQSTAHGFQT